MSDVSGSAGLPFATNGMRLIGEGFDTRVFLSIDGWVLKTAKYGDVLPRLTHERYALNHIPEISVAVPRNYQVIEPCPALPYGGAYYRHIEGWTCSTLTERQQRQLGRVLSKIHGAVPSAPIPSTPLVPWDWGRFERYLSASELETLEDAFAAYPSHCAAVRFVHGDIWPQNLIARDGQLVGLLDWAHSGIGDVAIDFAGLAYLPDNILDGVLGAYAEHGGDVGQQFPRRLTVARLNRELSGLHHAIIHPASDELDDSLRKLRAVLAMA